MLNHYLIIQFTLTTLENQAVNCLLVDEQQKFEQIMPDINLSQLTAHGLNQIIVVLLPTQQILLTKISLPKLSPTRLAQAIPYAIEEQLADDLANVHIVHSKQNTAGEIQIAVMNKKLLRSYLDLLQHFQLNPQLILPDVLALPCVSGRWTLFADKAQAWVKTATLLGFSCATANINSLLKLTLEQAEPSPLAINLLSSPSLIENIELEPLIANPHQPAPSFLAAVDLTAVTSSELNLLKGEFASRDSLHINQAVKSGFIKTCSLILAILVGSNLLQFVYLHFRQQHLQHEVATLAPYLHSNAASYQTLEQALFSLARTNQGGHLFRLLSPVAAALHQQSNSIELKELDFNQDCLIVKISANNADAVAQLVKALETSTVKTKLLDSNRQNGTFQASLKIH